MLFKFRISLIRRSVGIRDWEFVMFILVIRLRRVFLGLLFFCGFWDEG